MSFSVEDCLTSLSAPGWYISVFLNPTNLIVFMKIVNIFRSNFKYKNIFEFYVPQLKQPQSFSEIFFDDSSEMLLLKYSFLNIEPCPVQCYEFYQYLANRFVHSSPIPLILL